MGMIKVEQQLVFQYFALKLVLDKDDVNKHKHAAKANFAILNLILDRIAIEASVDRKPSEFKIGQKIKEYLEKSRNLNML